MGHWFNVESIVGFEGVMIVNEVMKTNTVLQTLRLSGERQLLWYYLLKELMYQFLNS